MVMWIRRRRHGCLSRLVGNASLAPAVPATGVRLAQYLLLHTRRLVGQRRWVRSLAFDPSNEWFCTGSADRTIKIWDVATGQLKLTLTGHIEQASCRSMSDRS